MSNAAKTTAEPRAILRAWMPFKKAMGVTSVHTKADYVRATATMNILLDEIGEDEKHPLADVLNFLSDQVKAYEEKLVVIPEAKPREVLRFLMDQHGRKQEHLQDCAPQSRISDTLNGKLGISKQLAKNLARRFQVNAGLFL